MRNLALIGLVQFFLYSCSGGAGFGAGAEANKEDNDASAQIDEEQEPVNVPEQVSGSYLTMQCGFVSDHDPEASLQKVGCVTLDENGNRFDQGGYRFELSLYDGKKRLPMQTGSSGDGAWDMLGDLPQVYMQSKTARLHMDVYRGNSLVAMSDFMVVNLGQDQFSQLDDGVYNLAYIETHTSWKPTGYEQYGTDKVGYKTEDFCNSNGATSEFSQQTQQAIEAVSSLPGGGVATTSLQVKTQRISSGDYLCFMKFAFGSGLKKYVHEVSFGGSPKCYALQLLRGGSTETLIIDVAKSSIKDQLSEAAITEFVQQHNVCGAG